MRKGGSNGDNGTTFGYAFVQFHSSFISAFVYANEAKAFSRLKFRKATKMKSAPDDNGHPEDDGAFGCHFLGGRLVFLVARL